MSEFQIILFLYLGSVQPMKISLNAPRYVKRGESITFNCTSESVPLGQSAEFLRNGKTYASLRHHKDGCFSTGIQLNCSMGECKCGMDGKSFVLKLRNVHSTESNVIEMSCVMKFLSGREISSSMTEILDIMGPYISTSGAFSFTIGNTVEFKCCLKSQLYNFVIEWQCSVEKINPQSYKTDGVYVSSFATILKDDHQGKTCTCIAKWKTFSSSKSIIINIIYPPSIGLQNSTNCNDSMPVQLNCHLEGELNIYGFMQWRQAINGVHIREIYGDDNGSCSTLTFPCSYQNAGSYTCNGWNEYENKSYTASKSIEVIVQRPPIILGNFTYIGTMTMFTVHYLPLSNEYSTSWYKNNQLITSLMTYTVTDASANITFPVYGKLVEVMGLVSNLSIGYNSPGKYTVVIRNRFGTTKHDFSVKNGEYKFRLHSMLLFLTGITLLIVICVLVAVVKKSRNDVTLSIVSNDSQRSRAIYYAAPQVDPNTHLYDTTDPDYSDVIPYQSSRIYIEITDNKTSEEDSQSQRSSESTPQYMEVI